MRRPSRSNGEAILLAAPGYAGKTTLAAGFAAAGHRVLSEDVSCLRLSSPPTLVPGPAMLRVRRDVAGRLEIPGASEVAVGDDRAHYSLDRAGRGDCSPLPVRAFVLLRHAEQGIALERVSPVDALRELWPLSFRLPTSRIERAASRASPPLSTPFRSGISTAHFDSTCSETSSRRSRPMPDRSRLSLREKAQLATTGVDAVRAGQHSRSPAAACPAWSHAWPP